MARDPDAKRAYMRERYKNDASVRERQKERARTPESREKRRLWMQCYRRFHSEKANESVRKSRAKKLDEHKLYLKKWRKEHLEKCRAYGSKWRKENPLKYNAVAKNWRATPNGQAYVWRRSLLRRKAGPVPTSVELSKRIALFSGSCAYCKRSTVIHLDHVVAVTKGGTNAIRNLVPACRRCNLGKSNRPWKEWYKEQSFFDAKLAARIQRLTG